MDDNAAQALAGLMADVVSGADPAVAAAVVARLAGLSGRDWLRVDERARHIYWGESVAFVAGIRLNMPAAGAASE